MLSIELIDHYCPDCNKKVHVLYSTTSITDLDKVVYVAICLNHNCYQGYGGRALYYDINTGEFI